MTADDRRTALATSLWLALATLLGGIDLPAEGYAAFRFAPFGVVAGLLGLVYVFALRSRGVLTPFPGWLDALVLVYAIAATATAFRVLLPPPGLLQAGLAFFAALAAVVVVTRDDRDAALVWVGVVAVALAVLRFALLPLFAGRSGLPGWGPVDLGAAANALRDLFVAYAPQRPAVQAVHLAALGAYAAALRTQWRSQS